MTVGGGMCEMKGMYMTGMTGGGIRLNDYRNKLFAII
jgi:hypothetical protein